MMAIDSDHEEVAHVLMGAVAKTGNRCEVCVFFCHPLDMLKRSE